MGNNLASIILNITQTLNGFASLSVFRGHLVSKGDGEFIDMYIYTHFYIYK